MCGSNRESARVKLTDANQDFALIPVKMTLILCSSNDNDTQIDKENQLLTDILKFNVTVMN